MRMPAASAHVHGVKVAAKLPICCSIHRYRGVLVLLRGGGAGVMQELLGLWPLRLEAQSDIF